MSGRSTIREAWRLKPPYPDTLTGEWVRQPMKRPIHPTQKKPQGRVTKDGLRGLGSMNMLMDMGSWSHGSSWKWIGWQTC